MTSIAVIGVRGYAAQYIRNLERLSATGAVQLKHILLNGPKDREAAAQITGDHTIKLWDDAGAFFDALAEVDFCCIPVGIPYHALFTIKALERGVDVLVEKPVAVGSGQLRQLEQAEAAYPGQIYVGFQHLYHPANRICKQFLLDGRIGKITKASAAGIWPRDYTYYRRNGWAGKLSAEGLPVHDSPLNNAFAHDVSMLLFLLGGQEEESAVPLRAEGHLYRNFDIESYDTAAVRLFFENDVEAALCFSHASPDILDPVIDIQGEKGRLVWAHHYYRFETENGSDTVQTDTEEATRAMMFDHIFTGQSAPPVCTLEHAKAQVLTVEMIHNTCTITDARANALHTRLTDGLLEQIPTFLGGGALL